MPDEQQLLDLIADSHQGIPAVVTRAGYPHLTNVLYVWDAAERIARVSTTADRVKGRILRRNPRAALHVAGPHFWSYAVAECDAETSEVATTPGDEACQELLDVASAFYGELDEAAFFRQMVDDLRLVVRLRIIPNASRTTQDGANPRRHPRVRETGACQEAGATSPRGRRSGCVLTLLFPRRGGTKFPNRSGAGSAVTAGAASEEPTQRSGSLVRPCQPIRGSRRIEGRHERQDPTVVGARPRPRQPLLGTAGHRTRRRDACRGCGTRQAAPGIPAWPRR
jgi:PPOX class probable F420-dependent enzyme